MSCATSSSVRRTARKPFLVLLLAKMSANEDEMTARKPKSASAQTACSCPKDPQPKIPARDQDACAFVARLVENEVRTFGSVRREAPVVEEKLAEASALDALQELLGDDLVGIDVHTIERRYATADGW